MDGTTKPRRTRVERGIYLQPNGNHAVCARRAGRLHFRTVGTDLAAARRARAELIAALDAGRLPVSPRLRFETAAAWWLARFEGKVVAGERHPPDPAVAVPEAGQPRPSSCFTSRVTIGLKTPAILAGPEVEVDPVHPDPASDRCRGRGRGPVDVADRPWRFAVSRRGMSGRDRTTISIHISVESGVGRA